MTETAPYLPSDCAVEPVAERRILNLLPAAAVLVSSSRKFALQVDFLTVSHLLYVRVFLFLHLPLLLVSSFGISTITRSVRQASFGNLRLVCPDTRLTVLPPVNTF